MKYLKTFEDIGSCKTCEGKGWLVKPYEETNIGEIEEENKEVECPDCWGTTNYMKKKRLKTFENFDWDDEDEEEDDILELAGLTGKFKISKQEFDDILACEDFNDAIYNTQTAIGQDDGGNAGMHFSDKSYEEIDEMWANGDREKIIIDYLKYENSVADWET